jgi:hypothetical protein
VARDATARLYDVDEDSVRLDQKAGTITFRARKGRLLDLDQLHESIRATRLSDDDTAMELVSLQVTAVGEVRAGTGEIRLQVSGSRQFFVLAEAARGKPIKGAPTAFQRLREALKRGEKVVSVTGQVEGWTGNFERFLKKLPGKPRRLLVHAFRTATR